MSRIAALAVTLVLIAVGACLSDAAIRPLHDSCKSIQAEEPESTDGVRALSHLTDDGTVSRQVYCDMTTDGGGWTLVARSAQATEPGEFGWTSSRGFLHDEETAYCLDATDIPFTEILIGSRSSGNDWATEAYKVEVPADFVAAASEQAIGVSPVTTVIGGCDQPGAPSMLSFAGFTANMLHYFWRDSDQDDIYFGLSPRGFNTNYNDCPAGGWLNGTQGMIFVR